MVESMETLVDHVDVVITPQPVPQSSSMVYLPVGNETLSMKSKLSVERTDRNVLISLNFDAYLIDRSSMSRSGPLVSRMAGHFNSQIRINLRDTLEAEIAGAPVVARGRLSNAN